MIYIGIDPGLHCGWAMLSATGQRLASGAWDLSSKRHEGAGMRWLRLRRYLSELICEEVRWSSTARSFVLGYEEVARHAGTDAAHVYGACIGEVQSWCELNAVPYRGLPVATVKRAATGKGNASKEMMCMAALLVWRLPLPIDDNEADALWIAETLRRDLE